MRWALPAGGLMLTVTAPGKAAVGIVQQCLALLTQLGVPFMLPAIQAYHLLYH